MYSLQVVEKSIERIDTSHEQVMTPEEEMSSNRKNISELLDLDFSASQVKSSFFSVFTSFPDIYIYIITYVFGFPYT